MTTVRDWTREDVEAMHRRYMDDQATLRELGAEQGITYERVRQLFKKYDLPTKKFKRQTLDRYAREYDAWAKKDEIIEAYKEHGTVDGAAQEVGIPRQYAAAVISEFDLRHLYRRKGYAPSYDEGYITDALQKAAKIVGEPLTIPAYRSVAPKHKFPADLTVIRAFGTWENACQAAGVKANKSEGPRRNSITADQCIQALRLCAADIGRIPSYELYNQWARANEMPSGGTVRLKVGPWSEALLLAFNE